MLCFLYFTGFILSQTFCFLPNCHILLLRIFSVHCSLSQWNCPTLFVWLLHKVPVTFLQRFEMDTPLCCFLLSHWRPIVVITLSGTHFSIIVCSFPWWNCPTLLVWLLHKVTKISCKVTFFVYKWTLSINSSTLLCVTVTQNPRNVLLLFLSRHFTLFLLFKSLLTYSHNSIVTHIVSGTVLFFLCNRYIRCR